MEFDAPISKRKTDHISINLTQDVMSGLSAGFENYHFRHEALPEISLHQVDTSTLFLGKILSAPILISSMTGGVAHAHQLNEVLARAAEELHLAMGLGSQRAALMHPDTQDSFKIRRWAPTALLFANLGAVQLNYNFGIAECQAAVEMIEADALILHFNSLMEAIQPEGDTDFSNLLPKIEQICSKIGVPVIAKEVGWGIDASTAKKLVEVGVSIIDVAGAGGTSWSEVEAYRLSGVQKSVAHSFKDWGIPTTLCLEELSAADLKIPIIASGGLENGIDLAKSLALGACLGGYARKLLAPANDSYEVLVDTLESIRSELKLSMFACGIQQIEQFKSSLLI
ncbi:MAG: type 2 isopentenyl-diphosphate Delta-isomerase [Anaerolineaceae bacterium]